MSQEIINNHLSASAEVKTALIKQSDEIHDAAQLLISCIRAGGRIYTCGNGGSACDAMHFVEELIARYKRERPGIAAQHLVDASTLTCWANDYKFETVFARQVETLLNRNDILVVFSTSGNSANVTLALDAAKKKGAKSLGLLGRNGGKALALCDGAIVVPSDVTAHIQEAHITIVHILCELLETSLYPSESK